MTFNGGPGQIAIHGTTATNLLGQDRTNGRVRSRMTSSSGSRRLSRSARWSRSTEWVRRVSSAALTCGNPGRHGRAGARRYAVASVVSKVLPLRVFTVLALAFAGRRRRRGRRRGTARRRTTRRPPRPQPGDDDDDGARRRPRRWFPHDHHDPHDPAAASARPDPAACRTRRPHRPGRHRPVVAAFEQRLADLHFDRVPSTASTTRRPCTRSRRCRRWSGINPAGRIGASRPTPAQLPVPAAAAPDRGANRTEIDVTKQVLTLYENYQVRLDHDDVDRVGRARLLRHAEGQPDRGTCARSRPPRRAATPSTCTATGGTRACSARSTTPSTSTRASGTRLRERAAAPASDGCSRIPMHIVEYFHTLVTPG